MMPGFSHNEHLTLDRMLFITAVVKSEIRIQKSELELPVPLATSIPYRGYVLRSRLVHAE
jgi:hypothetical protein